ncbi:flavin reductase family protein [Biformimicrobium ophioploci]|uniref:Flavin reductase like domain-containing protein n=1 Tax=Biformimicrobium ophioploci TaxID=3036711 RepID=A0ABQ6LW49_9GAMM|nr:flavin reductase family protein [Microbulbifer sp. NKW57]GMG86299.1 hypothetical protein MNKW57_06200 [Microbulbifer sp. NKW57]
MSTEAKLLTAVAPVEQQHTIEPLQLRQVFGQFATGVTIVTTSGEDGSAVGMTVSSFNTVSLEPPLILWCIDKKTGCFDAFNRCQDFAIHVLAQSQQDLSALFASRGQDKFEQVAFQRNAAGVPLLEDYCARIQCRISARHDGGDHVIIVGEVTEMHTQNREPLVFHRGRYASIC